MSAFDDGIKCIETDNQSQPTSNYFRCIFEYETVQTKPIQYTLLFFLFSFGAFAQEYRVFQEKDTSLYSTKQKINYVGEKEFYNGIKVDSLKIDIRKVDYFFPKTINYPDTNNNFCQKVGYFFLGPKLRVLKNGEQYIFDKNGDSLKIFSSDPVGTIWILKKLTDSLVLTATRIRSSVFSFQSITDSIYVFRMDLRDSIGNVIKDRIGGTEVWISKNYGIVKGINFYDMSYSKKYLKVIYRNVKLAGNTRLGGVLPMTYGELYDYEVGDEYHFRLHRDNVNPNHNATLKYLIYKKEITGKSIKYYRRVSFRFDSQDGSYHESFDTLGVFEVKDINEYVHGFLPGCLQSEKEINNYVYCKSQQGWMQAFKIYNGFSVYSDSCSERFVFEYWQERQWNGGIGITYYSGYQREGYGQISVLYYKKGNKTWGSPLSVNSNLDKMDNSISFYPNPAKDEITIESPNSETLTLLNLQGKILAKFKLDNSENAHKVQLPYLESGSYIILVQSEDKVITKKLQIVN